jgi:hypothetical protein
MLEACYGTRGISDLDGEALGGEKIHEPPAHLAFTPDDERAPPASLTLCGDPGLFLRDQRGVDEGAQQRFGETRRDPELRALLTSAKNHLAFTAEVARRQIALALDARDLGTQALASGGDLD